MGEITRREALRLLSYYTLGAIFLSCPKQLLSLNNVLTIPFRGIYVPGWKGVNKKRIDIVIKFLIQNQLNTLMIDVKNAHGELFYRPKSEIAKYIDAQVKTMEGQQRCLNMDYLLQEAQKHKIRLIARHVMFVDRILFENVPEFRLINRQNQHWVDMANQAVVDYNLNLIKQEAMLGFDEIVLDYIRFPDIPGFGTESDRCDTIDAITKSVKEVLKEANVELGIQVFGYSAWSHRFSNVGQRIETLQNHADIIYPMLYPSHFFKGSLGLSVPSQHPYEIIRQGCQAARSKIKTECRIIPMIQGFSYSSENIGQQILAVQKFKIPGFVSWNPSGNHSKLGKAMGSLQLE
ncbi:MAG: putative glycoside hydrolase [Marinifilaceae bacterium]